MKRCRTCIRNFLFLIVVSAAVACNTVSKIAYVQDIEPSRPIVLQEVQQLRIRPGDRLQITVFSRDHELADLFNQYDGASGEGRTQHPYTVDNAGEVEIPVLGKFQVVGLTRLELAEQVKSRLIAGQLIVDPNDQVEYADMAFYALGEVGHSGRILIPQDQLTILEAISLAGDLTIEGRRDKVFVFRTENGVQTPYQVDLRSMESVYGSPVYYMQQNDILYVEPNIKKANQSTVNGNNILTPGFWMSTFSMLTSASLLVMRLINNSF